MPRRSWESAIADAIRRLARRNAAFSRFPSKLIRLEWEQPGAVAVGAGGFLDEGGNRFDRHPRGDFAGDVRCPCRQRR